MPASAGFGAGTWRTFVGMRSPNTFGNPSVSTVVRRAFDNAWACCGINAFTPCSTSLDRTALARPGIDDDPSGPATSHATSSNATTDTSAPPVSSMA